MIYKTLRLMTIILIVLTIGTSCEHLGKRRVFTVYLEGCTGNVCRVHCNTVIYDLDAVSPVEDWYEVSPMDCNMIHGTSAKTFYGSVLPELEEYHEWRRDLQEL